MNESSWKIPPPEPVNLVYRRLLLISLVIGLVVGGLVTFLFEERLRVQEVIIRITFFLLLLSFITILSGSFQQRKAYWSDLARNDPSRGIAFALSVGVFGVLLGLAVCLGVITLLVNLLAEAGHEPFMEIATHVFRPVRILIIVLSVTTTAGLLLWSYRREHE